MGIVSIMAAILEDELRERGVLRKSQLDSEQIVRSMIQRTAELGANIKGRELGLFPRKQT
jgi:hypothetical protein